MRVCRYDQKNGSEINSKEAQLHFYQEETSNRSRFNRVMERKIERVWSQSKHLGWTYNDFAVHVLEVLVILQHRKKVNRVPASKKRINAEIAS